MKAGKKILSLVLAIIMIVCTMPFAFAEGESYKVGDIIQFGSYPQSEVKDESLLAELNALVPEWDEWISYGYYEGKSHYNLFYVTMQSGDWMRYIDITFNGYVYRAVKFIKYRPARTFEYADYTYSIQDLYGYNINNVYWFKFEPIDWRILDLETGLVMCETVIDAQPFNNTINGYFTDSTWTHFVNEYESSSIRKWLNNDFYNTAFTQNEKNEISTTTIDNKTGKHSGGYTIVADKETEEKIFILSDDDAVNNAYGFSSEKTDYDIYRMTYSSDYAKSQGVNLNVWLLRSPGDDYEYCCTVGDNGNIDSHGFETFYTGTGIRPALSICNLSEKMRHTHSYNSVITKQPTHLATGEKIFICRCRDSYTEPVSKTTEHTYTSEITTQPTHLKYGVETFTCECGDSYTEPVSKTTEHTYTSKITTQPTHTQEGVETFTCECDDSYTKPIAKLEKHTYSKVVTPPTCETQGFTTYICECGDSYKTDYISIDHNDANDDCFCDICGIQVREKTFFEKIADFFKNILEKLFGWLK